jgi:hypothetical protein
MAKMTRERTVKEKRAKKLEKKEARKLAAAEGAAGVAGEESTLADDVEPVEGETLATERTEQDSPSSRIAP